MLVLEIVVELSYLINTLHVSTNTQVSKNIDSQKKFQKISTRINKVWVLKVE